MIRQAPDFHDAIQSLAPGAGYIVTNPPDLDSIVWADELPEPEENEPRIGPLDPVDPIPYKPTPAEIAAEFNRLTDEYEAGEYARKRELAYPPIGDQLDALFHAGVFPEDMAAQLQAVKDEYPKGG
jgi:hypothetical protein